MKNHDISNELDDPLSSGKIGAYSGSIKAKYYKDGRLYKNIPPVDIHSELRSVLCNSKIKIKPYSVSFDKGTLVIDLPSNIKGSLANLIIVKTLTTVGLRYKCISCKLEIDNISKTICFHY
jgi:hypothetical protein